MFAVDVDEGSCSGTQSRYLISFADCLVRSARPSPTVNVLNIHLVARLCIIKRLYPFLSPARTYYHWWPISIGVLRRLIDLIPRSHHATHYVPRVPTLSGAG